MSGRIGSADGLFAGELGEEFREHSAWLHRRLACGLRAREADADDLVQETWLRFGRYDETERRRHPRALLLRIAANLVRDEVRRRRRRGEDHHIPVEPDLIDRETALAAHPDQLEALLLKQIVLGLPSKLRDVFLLARFTTLTQSEIARKLGISVKAVEWRMSRALALCAAQLREDAD